MKIERFPLQDRLALLDTGRCAHPEYAAAIIHRFADMTLPEYFQGFEAELERLRSTLGLSREQVQSMTYKQLAKALDDRLSMTPSCGDAYLYDAAALLLPPLLDTPPEQTELEEDGAPPLGQPDAEGLWPCGHGGRQSDSVHGRAGGALRGRVHGHL